MLVLSRKIGDKIYIGKDQEIIVTLISLDRGKARIGVEAPADCPIFRDEIIEAMKAKKEGQNGK